MKTTRETKTTIEKQLGKGAIMELGDAPREFPVLSSGVTGLDTALGGGWARNGIVEVYGLDRLGPAMDQLMFRTLAVTQRSGAAAYIDAEHTFDVCEAKRGGVDVGRLLVSQPDSGQQALEIVEMLTRSGAVDLVVVDAVRSLLPAEAINGDAADECPHLGTMARMFSQALRKIGGVAERSSTLVMFINRLGPRSSLGTAAAPFEATRNSLKFYAKQRVELRTAESGVMAHVCKNKMAAPFRSAPIDPTPEELGLVAGADVQVRMTAAELAHGPTSPHAPRFWFPGYRITRIHGDRAELQPVKPGAMTISVPLRDVRAGGRPLETA